MKMINKINQHGAIGEGVLMIYRLVLVAIIAIIVLGLSAIYYDYYIDVKSAEAQILAKQIVNCLAPNGVINLDALDSKADDVLKYCEIKNIERFYVVVHVKKSDSPDDMKTLKSGNDGIKSINEMYDKLKNAMKTQAKYEPGTYGKSFPVIIVSSKSKINGNLAVEVVVGSEL